MLSRCHPTITARAFALGTATLLATPGASLADPLRDEIEQLRSTLRSEIAALRAREQQLNQYVLRLDQRSQLLDRQLQALRATGPGRTGAAPSTPPTQSDAATATAARDRRPARREPQNAVTIAQAPAPAALPDTSQPRPTVEQSAPISGPSSNEQQAQRALEIATPVSSAGGILTPKGQVIITPSLSYDYVAQNQLGVNGFQIIPGITFGNITVNRVDQTIATAAVTGRIGITDRLELNLRVPYTYNSQTTTSTIPVGVNPTQLSTNASNSSIGDIQVGASYQINAGRDDWPIFIANLAVKSTTGVSPYDVPIYTREEPDAQFRAGLPKRTPTGTGFYSVSPSLTAIYPTAPGTLFANLLYVNNIGARQQIRSLDGGPSSPLDLTPGQSVGLTVGIGFALNERASLSLSYQQQYVFEALQNGQALRGSAYSFGSFNFGVGYELSERTRVNVNAAIGVGPNTPAARLVFEVPYRFSL